MTEARSAARSGSSARRKGRRAAYVVYYGLVGVLCVICTVQLARQVFAAGGDASPYPTCHDGLRALVQALERARTAAPGTDGEDAAIQRFRAALEPEWRRREGIEAKCRASANDRAALDAIDRLRYAEEHAARREAGDLAPLRRRVQAIVDHDLAPTESPAPSPGAPR